MRQAADGGIVQSGRQGQGLLTAQGLGVSRLAIEVASVARGDLDLLAHDRAPVTDDREGRCEGRQVDARIGEQIPHGTALTVGIDGDAEGLSLLRCERRRAGQCRRLGQGRRLCLEGAPAVRRHNSGLDAQRGQPLIGVVGAESQPILGAAGEHAVGLGHTARDQIIDHDADIGLVPPQHDFRGPRGGAGGVQTGNQPLSASLFIPGRTVDLTGQIEPRAALDLQRRRQLARIDVIVFDRIAEPEHLDLFQSGHGAQEGVLRLRRDRGGDAVRIDGRIVQALGLQEDLVRGLVGETDDLVLDRGTVARTDPGQLAAIHGALAEIGGDDGVGLFSRMGDAAGDLAHVDPVGQEAEGHRLRIRLLHLQPVPGDGAAVEARGRAGL